MNTSRKINDGDLRFTHLTLQNWRNFGRVDVSLQRRTFLVGPNASGKSNLLDVFRFLRDIALPGGGLQAALSRPGRRSISALRCLAARRYPDILIAATLGTEGSLNTAEYELQLYQDKHQRPMVRKERVAVDGRDVLVRPLPEDKEDPERLTQTYLEQVNTNRDFRDVVEFLASVHYFHVVPQLIREPDRSTGRHNDPFGGDFLEWVARTAKKQRDARLRRVCKALQVAVPQLEAIELTQDTRGTPHLRGKYAHWRPQGAWQTEEQFSDGTLRLMGLLWSMLEGDGPLLLEEPELSLHPEVVRMIPQMFARMQRRTGRQVFVSTHSTSLLRDEGIGLDEVLLLMPESEGTEVRRADEFAQIRALLDGGQNLADAVVPYTSPQAEQLSLFADG